MFSDYEPDKLPTTKFYQTLNYLLILYYEKKLYIFSSFLILFNKHITFWFY